MALVITVVERTVRPDGPIGQVDPHLAPIEKSEPEVRELVGQSRTLRVILRQIELVAPTDATVLILGESGTGKELVAREIHKLSRRRHQPLVRVNCASIPRELYESEFFGHVKGAFTGAMKDRAGRFESADGGTLFLDEVGEIPPELQNKLLRVLQEGEYERVGEETIRRVDVRIIAATNRDLMGEVEAGRFRQDLYYRLNTLHLQMPPLREREDDIIDLAYCFLEKFIKEQNKSKPRDFSIEALRVMRVHNWPGNVRELINRVERAVLFCDDRLIAPKHLDLDRRNNSRQIVTIEEARKRAEHDAIHIAIQHANGNLTRAAKVLGISRASLYRLCKFNVEMNENNQAHRKLRK